MTLSDLEQILDMKTELELLTRRLKNIYERETITDVVKDYRSGYGRNLSVTGLSAQNRLSAEHTAAAIRKHRDLLAEKILHAEDFILAIPDSRVRVLCTMRYLEGVTWAEAGESFYRYMSADSARKAVGEYFKNKGTGKEKALR